MSVELNKELLQVAQARLGWQMAVEASGTMTALAEGLGVSRASVSAWKWRGIPATHCLKIHALTGVPLHDLRPDIYPTLGTTNSVDA
jgi:DNA-binding transcriptional regulator YdaS (Cro superfamily)